MVICKATCANGNPCKVKAILFGFCVRHYAKYVMPKSKRKKKAYKSLFKD